MKRILSLLLSVAILTLSLLGVVGCSDDNDEYPKDGKYNLLGLNFYLPEEYKKITVPYSQNVFYDGKAYFYFNVYSEEQMESTEEGGLGISKDISIKNYTIKFLGWNGLSYDKYTYDEQTDRSFVKYVYEYEAEDGMEDELYIHVFFRGSQRHLYCVTMSCPVSLREQYESTFDSWSKSIYPD